MPHSLRRTGLRWGCAFALIFLYSACSNPPEPTPAPSAENANALAVVGDSVISVTDLTDAMHQRGAARFQTPESREALLEQLVQRALQVQAARAAGYDRAPEVIRARQRALVAKLRADRLEPKWSAITVDGPEIEAYYRAHPADYTRPGRIRAAVIRIGVPPRARPEKRRQLARRVEEARAAALKLPEATRTFGSVAVKYSDDRATRYRGGDTGWIEVGVPRTRWGPEVTSALLTLRQPGEIAPTVTTDSGHYLVRLIGREAEALRPLSEVSAQIRHQIVSDKRAAAEREFMKTLETTVAVSVHRDRLRTVPAPKVRKAATPKPPSLPE